MAITKDELQQRRSPKELWFFAHRVRDEASVDPLQRTEAYSHKGLYKQFIDEILPLSDFAVLQYPETCTVEPVLGSQGYDAIIFDSSGHECDRIEIKKPYDGAGRAEDGRLILERGYGNDHGGVPGYELVPLIPFVLATCQATLLKDYSDCTLVFVVPVLEPFPFPDFQQRFETDLANLARQISDFRLNAKRVFLFVPPKRVLQIVSAPTISTANRNEGL